MENLFINIMQYIVQIFLCTYILIRVTQLVNNINYNKKTLTSSIIVGIGVVISLTIRNFIPLVNIFVSFCSFFITSHYILKYNLMESFLYSIATLTFGAITEMIAVFLGITILHTDYSNIVDNNLKLILLMILQVIITIIILEILSVIIKKRAYIADIFINISIKQVIFLVISLIICIFPQIIILGISNYSYPSSLLIINSIQFVVISLSMFIYLNKSIEHDKTQSELYTSELHNKTLVGMVDGVNKIKHDYNNIIQGLMGYASTKEYDKMQDYLTNLFEECNIINNLSLIDPKIFNEPAIYGIVGAKFLLANKENIRFDLKILIDISKIEFSMPDLSRILGILLDNAIEATKKSETPYILLEMRFDKRRCADIIRIVNSYDATIDINTDDIYKKGFSTKKVKSGIGLWEVKELVGKTKNSQIFADIENKKFVQTIVIEKID